MSTPKSRSALHPSMEPINGKVQPLVVPIRPGRVTNKLKYLQHTVLPALWAYEHAWPFHVQVDTIKLKLAVSRQVLFCSSHLSRPLMSWCYLLFAGLLRSHQVSHGSGNCDAATRKPLLPVRRRLHPRHQHDFCQLLHLQPTQWRCGIHGGAVGKHFPPNIGWDA
jgi:hypothetical protein